MISPPPPVAAAFPWADPFLTVGVTGTNGKTSTTYLVAHALRAAGQSVVTQTTLGYALDDQPIEVRRTLEGFMTALHRAAQAGCRHAAIEVTSEALAQGFARRWRFDIAVFTNLTRDHLDVHLTWEHYLASKAQLFLHLAPEAAAVFNACDEVTPLLEQVTHPDVRRFAYAFEGRGRLLRHADLTAQAVTLTPDSTAVTLAPSDFASALGGELRLRLVGEVFAENALAAACAGIAAGIPAEQVRAGIAQCPPIPGRFEVIGRAPLVVVDFAHSPDALARACETARKLVGAGRVIVVFGAGGERDQGKREPMGRAVGERADVAIITTDNPRREDPITISKALSAGCRRGGRAYTRLEPDRRTAIDQAISMARAGDVVLVAGKGHERGQTIGTEVLPFSDVDVVREHVGVKPADTAGRG